MKTFTYHSARASYRQIGELGVMELVFTGLLCVASFEALRIRMLPLMRLAAAVVVRYDRALVMIDGVPEVDLSLHRADEPHVALIVGADHYTATVQFCAKLAELGLIRAVFLNSPEQSALAYRWAERHALLTRQVLTV